ncbi:MAG: glycosyltransferase [Chthoniobacterales bacterium]|nr:glycosyltransferase [Chthoniobacterales bacterium]MBA3608721.1 glycosyltransferase [Chthoniobacterales bacterium]
MNAETAASTPAFSVVIASWSGTATLIRCLESLLPQVGAAEVIVACRGESDFLAELKRRFGGVHFINGGRDASVFRLRSLGVREARGASIAMLEDHAAVCDDWVRAIFAGSAKGKAIVGGPIENDPRASLYDWALYFVEYGIYMPPMPAGETPILSGVNIAYEREALASCRGIWDSVFYETDVNAALSGAGYKLFMLPEACVESRLQMGLREAMEHLFTGGRHFGEFRKLQSSSATRLLLVLAAPAILFVLLFRIVRQTAARQPARLGKILLGLPYLVLLLGAWSAGEAASYLRSAKD